MAASAEFEEVVSETADLVVFGRGRLATTIVAPQWEYVVVFVFVAITEDASASLVEPAAQITAAEVCLHSDPFNPAVGGARK